MGCFDLQPVAVPPAKLLLHALMSDSDFPCLPLFAFQESFIAAEKSKFKEGVEKLQAEGEGATFSDILYGAKLVS
jgi:hypothetical protein